MPASRPFTELARTLSRLHGGGYGQYRQLVGEWAAPGFTLAVVRAQADPFAPPSRLEVRVLAAHAGLPAAVRATPVRRRALADWLLRQVAGELREKPFAVDAGGQEVLSRSACEVMAGGDVVLRAGLELPGPGRRIDGRAAAGLLCERLPEAVERGLRWREPGAAAWDHVHCVEDACALRDALPGLGLVAFVADGSVLPRLSGASDLPLTAGALPFASPPSLAVQVDLPHRGRVAGMGVAEGITLVVGGGFHGKSTLLRAIERGVYDHVPGDGRELVVTRADAVRIRAEDGRRVARVDISGFVADLPTGGTTSDFSTENASGSTSQAANVVEAIEVGARALLIDEDTAATNLMVRDVRMRELVAGPREPLTPLVDVVRSLHRDHGVSTVLVMGGCGDYLDVADRVVAMDAFSAADVTARGREVAAAHPRPHAVDRRFPAVRRRVIDGRSLDAASRGRLRLRPRGLDALSIGEATIRLGALEQLVDPSQVAGIGLALARLADGGVRPLAEALDELEASLGEAAASRLAAGWPGDVALPRRFEVAAALDRHPALEVAHIE